ncbi:hypothetical protein [Methanococcus voltae]|uniref:Uncharacterized protein n=1 Tax=Methanococcus voltae (strain ATCC BAA-1334 / A3) TaxID=456320 RepID=D7DT15_METV3|nr:hypothetical protein [Methanococcus voltae]MCS3901949.1 hypothetical protein [Methanococcus voltae]
MNINVKKIKKHMIILAILGSLFTTSVFAMPVINSEDKTPVLISSENEKSNYDENNGYTVSSLLYDIWNGFLNLFDNSNSNSSNLNNSDLENTNLNNSNDLDNLDNLDNYTNGKIVDILEKDENGVYDVIINKSNGSPLIIRISPETKLLCDEQDLKTDAEIKVGGNIVLRCYPGILIANSVEII